MVVHFRLPSGLDIFGLPTGNFYSGNWDLGPTWNYSVMADTPFLVDAGRHGQGKQLLRMMDTAGVKPSDLGYVLISHGHEDHDGGLAELVGITSLKVKAHAIYDLLIRQYPDMAPANYKRHFPAKCWHCFMPESFYTVNCLAYHRMLQHLEVETVGSGFNSLCTDITTCHLPGHSPDCLAVILGEEAVIVGDILLPQITPLADPAGDVQQNRRHRRPYFSGSSGDFGPSSLSPVLKAAQAPGYGASGYAGASSTPLLL